MQDKEFQQPAVQHKKAYNWVLYASFSASGINILWVFSLRWMQSFIWTLLYSWGISFFLFVWIAAVVAAIVFGHIALYKSRHNAELQSTRTWSFAALLCAYAVPLLEIGLLCTALVISCAGRIGTGGCS